MNTDLITFCTAGSVIFGNNAIEQIGEIANKNKTNRILVITDKGVVKCGLIDRLTDCLSDHEHVIYDEIDHTPSFETIRKCTAFVKKGNFDLLIGFGGGSVMDATKAVSIMATNKGQVSDYLGSDKVTVPALPKILITTTSGTGSEVTIFAMLGQRDTPPYLIDGIYDKACLPEYAIVDPTLTLGIPKALTANTGLDALSHAIECYVNTKSSFHNKPLALEAIRLIFQSLEKATIDGSDLEARYNLSAGSLLAGLAFNQTGSGIGHGIGEAFQVEYDIQHGTAIAIVLPHVMRFNHAEKPSLHADMAKAMGVESKTLTELELAKKSVDKVRDLIAKIGLPQKLSEVGISEQDLAKIATTALELSPGLFKKNLRPVSKDDVFNLLQEAY
jgi:alcohol dehydrogenase